MKLRQLFGKSLSVFLTGAMLLGLFVPVVGELKVAAATTDTNVAKGKPVTVEYPSASYPGAMLTDGNTTTLWDTGLGASSNETVLKRAFDIVIDLESVCSLSSVTVFPFVKTGRYYYYEIFLSIGGTEYRKVAEKSDATAATKSGFTYPFSERQNARYVKLVANGASNGDNSHICEVQAKGYALTPTKTDLTSLIERVEAMDLTGYTTASLSTLNTALLAAKATAGDSEAAASDVAGAWETLAGAEEALSYPNAALGKEVTAYHSADSHPASLITNGKFDEYWDGGTPTTEDKSVVIDLGKKHKLNKFIVYPYGIGQRSYRYELHVSEDGASYTKVAEKTTSYLKEKTEGNTYHFSEALTARYVKLVMNGSSGGTANHLYEVEAYGTPLPVDKTELTALIAAVDAMDLRGYTESTLSALNTALTAAKEVETDDAATETEVNDAIDALAKAKAALAYPNVALNKPVDAYHSAESRPASFITDGKFDDYWDGGTPSTSNRSVIIDLESVHSIEKFKIFPYRSGRSYYYEIHVSTDGVNYAKVAEKTEKVMETEAGTTYAFSEMLAVRYIKIVMNGNSSNSANHLYEFEAYGKTFEADKASLRALIEKVEALDTGGFTLSSVAAMTQVLLQAKSVAEKSDATASEIKDVAAALLNAKQTLVPITAQGVLSEVIGILPTLSSDGTKLLLPQFYENFEVSLYGSSNEAVVALDGIVSTPLEDMTVSVMYQVTDKNDPTVTAVDQYTELTLVIPGRFEAEEGDNARPQVLPAIREWKGHKGTFSLTSESRLVLGDAALSDTGARIAEYFEKMLGKTLPVVQGSPVAGDIFLSLSNKANLGEEGYEIAVGDTVTVEAYKSKGVLYAGTTLTQILSQDENGETLPKGLIRDYPEYEVRSVMIDVGRTYMPLKYLDEITRYLAYYKYNQIHVHINEDNGEQKFAFRLESKLYPQINSGLGERVYSQEDYRRYQKDALKYGVKVVTEIDTPGHSGFIGFYNPDYTLGFNDDMDIRNEEAVAFVKAIFDEFLDGEDPVIQGDEIHVGCDEYLRYDNTHFSEYRVEAVDYYVDIINHVEQKGLKCRMWNMLGERVYPGVGKIDPDVTMQYFSGGQAAYPETIEAGYPIINSDCYELYVVSLPTHLEKNYASLAKHYDNWDVNILSTSITLPNASPLLLGAEPCYWGDRNLLYSEMDVFHLMKNRIMLIAEKNWYGEKSAGQTSEEFLERVATLGTHAPDANPSRVVKSKDSLVASYDFDAAENSLVKDKSTNGYDAVLNGLSVTDHALSLDGTGTMSLPFASLGYPFTVSFDLYAQSVAENALLFSGNDGKLMLNYNGTGKIAYERKGFTFTFDYVLEPEEWTSITLFCDGRIEVLDTYLCVNGTDIYKGEFLSSVYENPVVLEDSTSFVLPVEQIGKGVVGKLDNLYLYRECTLGKDELRALIESVEALVLTDYTASSVTKLNTALASAKTVMDQTDATTEEIYEACVNLAAAKNALAYPNIALGKTVTTEENADKTVYITDGYTSGSMWESITRDAHSTLILDLETVCRISKFKIFLNRNLNRSYYYEIHVSTDGETYTKVAEKTAISPETSTGTAYEFSKDLIARYVKIVMKCNTVNGFNHIYEFEAYGVPYRVDKAELNALADAASELDLTEYTADSVAVLEEVLSEANVLLEKIDATQGQINRILAELKSAMDALQIRTLIPAYASLILSDKIGVKLFFHATDVNTFRDFDVEISIGEKSVRVGELTQKEQYYYVQTMGLGLEEFDDTFTLGGNAQGAFSIAQLAGIASQEWTDSEVWKNWADSVVNLNAVYNLDEPCSDGADLDKVYPARQATQGNKVGDLDGAPFVSLLMSNVVGLRFTVNFKTMPKSLKVICNTVDLSSYAKIEGNTATVDLFFAAHYLEDDFKISIQDGDADTYFTFIGSASGLAQELAKDGNEDAEAVLWYIQAAARVAREVA